MKEKIVIEVQAGSSEWVRRGWGNVFKYCGYDVMYYYADRNPVHMDIFNQAGPVKLFIGTTYNLNRSLLKIIKSRPEMKVALFCSAWGNLIDSLDLKEYPIDVVKDEEKKNVEYIRENVECVFIHITEFDKENIIGGWKNVGVKPVGILNGADLFTYYNAKPDPKYMCAVGFVGGRWNYKAKTLDPYIGRLCRERWQDLNIKIFGSGWDVPQWLGRLNQGEDAKLFASSYICPNISEPHSYVFDDIIERIYKIPVAGGFLISDNVCLDEVGLTPYVPQFENYDELIGIIEYYLDNPEKRQMYMEHQHRVVLEQHTYFDRMAKLCDNIGMEDVSKFITQKKTEFLK